jgi:hypothetical protein
MVSIRGSTRWVDGSRKQDFARDLRRPPLFASAGVPW